MSDEKSKTIEDAVAILTRAIDIIKGRQDDINSVILENILDRVKDLENAVEVLDLPDVALTKSLEKIIPEFGQMKERLGKCIEICDTYKRHELRPEVMKFVDQAKNLLERGNGGEALTLMKAQKGQLGIHPLYWFHLGFLYQINEKNRQAIASFKKAIELDSSFFEAHCALLNIFGATDNRDEALDIARLIIHQFPMVECLDLCGMIGRLVEIQGSIKVVDDLVEDLTYPERLDCPKCFAAYLYLMVGASKKGWEIIQDVDSECTVFPLLRVVTMGHMGRKSDAVATLEKADLSFKLMHMTHHLISKALDLFDEEKHCESLRTFVENFARNSKYKNRRDSFGRLLEQAALQSLTAECPDSSFWLKIIKKTRKYHDCPVLRLIWAEIHLEAGRGLLVKRIIETALKDYPDDNYLVAHGSRLLSKTGYKDEVESLAERALNLKAITKNPDLMLTLARAVKRVHAGNYDVVVKRLHTTFQDKDPEKIEWIKRKFPVTPAD